MTGPEFQKMFQERVVPMLSEMGVEGFLLAGYVEDGDRIGRFALTKANNPMAEDGLQKLVMFASMWSAPAREFAPPGSNTVGPEGAVPPP